MTKREVIQLVFDGERPPYVPWSFGFTVEAHRKLVEHYGTDDLEDILGNDLPRDYYVGFADRIAAVTPQSVTEVAQRSIRPDTFAA